MNLYHLIKKPIITEKSLRLAGSGLYTFSVAPKATKGQVKEAVAKHFGVKVVSVHTMTVAGKTRRQPRRRSTYQTSDWKKALVQLPSGQKIDLFTVEEKTPTALPAKAKKAEPKATKSKS